VLLRRKGRKGHKAHSILERVAAKLAETRRVPFVGGDLAGSQCATLVAHGDVVLARKDAMSSYHLAVTIDDAAQGVTDIVRGQDLFSATNVHRVLQGLLGLPTPRYHHHPLLIGRDGLRLAKRKNAPSLASLREAGIDPVRLIDGMRQGRFPIGFGREEA
jgi:glutamyl-Q tRNA(Asp) synthetase